MEKKVVMRSKLFVFFVCTLQKYKAQWIAESKCERPPHERVPRAAPQHDRLAAPRNMEADGSYCSAALYPG
jgi:hypothetical protein